MYARYCVQYYWLIDPARRSVVAYVLQGSGYSQAAVAHGSESFAAAPFADLVISLPELWA